MSHPPQGGYPRGMGPRGQSYGPPGQPPGPPPGPPPPPGGRDPYGRQPGGHQGWQPQQPPQSPQDAYAPYLRSGYDEPPPAADLALAPILRRARARLIDFVLVAAFGFGLIFPLMVAAFGLNGAASDAGEEGGIWTVNTIFALFFVSAVLPFLYEAIQLPMYGQTIGKRILGLSVVRTDPAGEPVGVSAGVWRAAINNVGYQVPIFLFLLLAQAFTPLLLLMFAAVAALLIAYLRAAWDRPLHQAVHDKYAATVVVDDRVVWEDEEE
jgi:uncharacterized RDD family membrane protein YckC